MPKHAAKKPRAKASQADGLTHDVFISYSHQDQTWVQGWLVPRLKRAGLRVCVDVESFEPGAPAVLEMERAVTESKKTVLVLTPAYLESKWTRYENVLSYTIDPGSGERRTIPIVLETCNLPLRVNALIWIDFREPRKREQSCARLVSSIRRPLPGPDRSGGARGDSGDAGLRSTKKRFLDYLLDRYQHLDFRGMGISDRIALQLPLVEMYVPLKARPELPKGEAWSHELRVAGRKLTREEAANIGERVGKPRPVVELLRKHPGVVVLGDPGAGKTTLLKYLALCFAAGDASEFKLGRRLPVLVPLSAYAQALATGNARLDDFVDEYYRALGLDLPLRDLVARALADGRGLLLLDGLDEVREVSRRREVVDRVVHFFTAHQRAGNKFVITSRIVGYRDVRPTAEGLVECTLVDFDDEDIEAFVTKWTAALERAARGRTKVAAEEAAAQRQELLAAIQRNPGVRALASNPLLLTILALMKRQGVVLPDRRVELYDTYVQTLLKTWNLARSLDLRRAREPAREFDARETVKVLAPLALWMHETSPGVGLVKEGPLRRKLEEIYAGRGHVDAERAAGRFLEDVHEYAGLLVERGPRQYGFLHLTFQEYLAGVAIGQLAQKEKGRELVTQALTSHVGERTWHEVSLLSLGYLAVVLGHDELAGAVLEELIASRSDKPGEAAALAGEAVADMSPGGVTPACRAKVVQALLTTMPDDARVAAPVRAEAGDALGRLGDPRFRADAWHLPADPLLGFVEIPAGPFLMGSDKTEDPDAFDDELPQHEVTLPAYYIARYPVTVAQFRAFVEAAKFKVGDADCLRGTPNHPVAAVSWDEALAYCAWLTKTLRAWDKTPEPLGTLLRAGSGDGKPWVIALPSEAEWEKAGRGTTGRIYPWGDDFGANRANSSEADINSTTAVGCFPGGASRWGADEPRWVEELSGNVWEWTRSLWGPDSDKPQFGYPYVSNDGREDLKASAKVRRVLRGGSFDLNRRGVRSACRYWFLPGGRYDLIGFRVVVSPFRS